MPSRVAIPRRTLFLLVGLVLAVIAASWAYARLPRAKITVQAATFERSVSQEITLSAASREPDFVRFILPAKLAEAEIAESKTVTRESSKTFDDFARGTVKIINQQDEEQRLLPKTHLRHEASGVFFLTDSPVTVPPLGEVTVGVTAKEKGPVGNVPAGKFIIDKLPASAQALIYAQSATDFTGGVSTETSLTEAEIKQAKDEVKQRAQEKAAAELSTKAGGVRSHPELITIQTEEETVSAAPGSKTTAFTVTTKVKARGFFPDDNDLLSLTLLALRSSPQADEEFVSYAPDSFQIEVIRSDFSRQEARIKGTLRGSFARKTGPTLFAADNLAGRTAKEVQEYFKQFPSVGSVEVEFSPFWVTTVPARAEAVEIIVKSANK